jgi:hypothetical protein
MKIMTTTKTFHNCSFLLTLYELHSYLGRKLTCKENIMYSNLESTKSEVVLYYFNVYAGLRQKIAQRENTKTRELAES